MIEVAFLVRQRPFVRIEPVLPLRDLIASQHGPRISHLANTTRKCRYMLAACFVTQVSVAWRSQAAKRRTNKGMIKTYPTFPGQPGGAMASTVLRVTSILLCVAAISTAAMTLLSIFVPLPEIRPEVHIALFLMLAGSLLSHQLQQSENINSKVNELLQRHASVEVFHSNDEWAARMIDITSQSTRVSTQMYSDPPSTGGSSYEKYFRECHRALKSGKIRSFRRIATTSSQEKVRWLLSTVAEMHNIEAYSLAIADVSHEPVPLTAFHVCESASNIHTFVFSSIPAHGVMNAFMIQNKDIGNSVRETYEVLWTRARKLKEGNRIHLEAITELAAAYGLAGSQEYARLKALHG